MIRPEMAQKFIDQITDYTEYNINIMDESGVIIASRSKDRIGTYHEAADRIVRGKEDIVVVDDDKLYPGVLPGINMAIIVNGKKEGVVGVTGSPSHIREVAMVTRLAIEAMLKYEKQQENILLRQGRKESFFQLLLRVDDADPAELRAAAQILGYDESHILSYMTNTLDRLDRGDVDASFYVGTPQKAFSQYIHSYHHARWLEKKYRKKTKETGDDRIHFFFDHASEYFYSVIPKEELHRVFYQYNNQIQGEERIQFSDTTRALIEANFNLTEAAKLLFVHKNTMLYRYNKLKNMLDIDPLRNSSDRTFLILLYLSLL